MKKFLKFAFKPHRLEVYAILIFLIVQTYMQLEIISLFKSALNHVKTENLALLNADGLWMLIYSTILIVSMIVIVYLANDLSVKIAHETREKIFHIITRLPTAELNKFKSTDIMLRTTREIFLAQSFIQVLLKYILIIPFVTLGIIIEILWIDKEFALFFTMFVLIVGIVIVYKLKAVSDDYFNVKKTYGKINFLFREKIAGLKTIQVFKKKFFEREKFNNAINESYDKSLEFQLNQYYISPLFILISDLFIVALLIYLFDFTIDPTISIINHTPHYKEFVNITIIIQYMLYFASTVIVLQNLIDMWPKAYASSIRIEEMLALEDKIIENKSKNSKSDFKGIEFRNVSFKNNEHDIIKNVSFKIPNRSTVAIVGPYSSGKTVLMYLLDGIYEATEGEILIDGIDINDLTSEELKGKINFAMRKNFIFKDTVYNNITLGDKSITKSDVVKACDASGLSNLFSDEVNLDTIILENSSNVSNGFKKKITLARSIVHDKDIYIFDEHDYRVENKTNIILTKDIEQIKDIEHIVVLDKGQLMGEGNHEELLKNCLVYKELYMGARQ